MPRPRLSPGTYGNIYSTQAASGAWTAKARFRDLDGKTRLIERTGPSKAKAELRLKEHLTERAHQHQSSELKGNSPVSLLATQWWEQFEEQGRAVQTSRMYQDALRLHLLPRIGELTLNECTPGRLTLHVKGIATDHGYSSAKRAKSVLSNMFKFAVSRDAVPRNPVRDVQLPAQPKSQVKALSYFEAVKLREQLTDDVQAILDVLLGTGCRIGEVLALRWQDLDLRPGRSSVNINGTLVHDAAGKLIRQSHPKSKSSEHSLFLPEFVAEMLRERRDNHLPAHARTTAWATPAAYVFPSTAGTAWEPSNFRKKWRAQVTAAGFPGLKPHEIRKTVATYLANAEGISAASLQLGHSSESITEKHYVMRDRFAPDMSALLQAFGNPSMGI